MTNRTTLLLRLRRSLEREATLDGLSKEDASAYATEEIRRNMYLLQNRSVLRMAANFDYDTSGVIVKKRAV